MTIGDQAFSLTQDANQPQAVVGWGRNENGQSTPPLGNCFVAIAAGDYQSLTLAVGQEESSQPDHVGVFRNGFFWLPRTNGNRQFDGTETGQDYAFPFGGLACNLPVVGVW